jgi:hypothetical protein
MDADEHGVLLCMQKRTIIKRARPYKEWCRFFRVDPRLYSNRHRSPAHLSTPSRATPSGQLRVNSRPFAVVTSFPILPRV